MFFICLGCSKMVFYLDNECPYCGKEIVEEREDSNETDVLAEEKLVQLRLFEC